MVRPTSIPTTPKIKEATIKALTTLLSYENCSSCMVFQLVIWLANLSSLQNYRRESANIMRVDRDKLIKIMFFGWHLAGLVFWIPEMYSPIIMIIIFSFILFIIKQHPDWWCFSVIELTWPERPNKGCQEAACDKKANEDKDVDNSHFNLFVIANAEKQSVWD